MSRMGMPDRRTPEEKAAYEAERRRLLWFEPGRTYTFELGSHWVSGFGFYRLEDWAVYIRQAECPWTLIAMESFQYRRTILGIPKMIARWRAARWGTAYLKRGGPPEGYWRLYV